MPLTLAEVGEENIIRKIGGKQEVKAHLENLGFVVGGEVTVVSAIGGNVIVNVKDSRIAVSKEMDRTGRRSWSETRKVLLKVECINKK